MLNAFRFALIYGIYTAEFSNSWKLGKELVAFLTGSSKIDFLIILSFFSVKYYKRCFCTSQSRFCSPHYVDRWSFEKVYLVTFQYKVVNFLCELRERDFPKEHVVNFMLFKKTAFGSPVCRPRMLFSGTCCYHRDNFKFSRNLVRHYLIWFAFREETTKEVLVYCVEAGHGNAPLKVSCFEKPLGPP